MQFTMERAVMEQSASSEQEIAMLTIGQRIAPSMTSLTNFFIVKWFSLFDICFVPGHYVKSALRGILPRIVVCR